VWLEFVFLTVVIDRLGPRLKRHLRRRQNRIEDAEDGQPQAGVFRIFTAQDGATIRVTRGRLRRRTSLTAALGSGATTLTTGAATTAASASAASALREDRRRRENYQRKEC
jgi:hypothetical protein